MRMICVSADPETLEHNLSLLKDIGCADGTKGFISGKEALLWLDAHRTEGVLLDIDIPDMSGFTLAQEIRKKQPRCAIIFLAGSKEHAAEAFAVHANGYLIKPVDKERLREEIRYITGLLFPEKNGDIVVKTFGVFDIYVNGEPVRFRRSKSKELLAYLIDKRGGSCKRDEVFYVLWESREYDRPMQKQLDVVIRSLKETLSEYGIERIFELKGGNLRVCPETFTCDVYSLQKGDPEAADMYQGEYMSYYSWASVKEGYLTEWMTHFRSGKKRP